MAGPRSGHLARVFPHWGIRPFTVHPEERRRSEPAGSRWASNPLQRWLDQEHAGLELDFVWVNCHAKPNNGVFRDPI